MRWGVCRCLCAAGEQGRLKWGRLMVVVAAVVVAAAVGGADRPSILLILALRPCGSNAEFWAEILCFFPGRI